MESIQLSQQVSKGLLDLELIDEEVLRSLCLWCVAKLLGKEVVEQDVQGHPDAISAVSTLFLEATRAQTSPEQLRMVVAEQGLGAAPTQVLLTVYREVFAALTQHLKGTSIGVQQIVDIDWRLDYHVRGKNTGRDNYPMYFVSFKVKENGEIRSHDMVCTYEEIQDLLSKCREAIKQVDRILVTAEGDRM